MGLAAAALGAGALSAGAGIYGSSQQAGAAKDASNQQRQMFDILQGNLQPYMTGGADAFKTLQGQLPSLTAPFNPTMAQLESTPGYQFTKQQGMNAVNNSNSTKGWGQSGPGAKGIADYVTGLASNTFNQQFSNYWNQNQDIYSMLMGPSQLGESAGANVGAGAISTGAGIASNTIGAGNAAAAGAVGAANGINSGVMNYAALTSPWWQGAQPPAAAGGGGAGIDWGISPYGSF